MLNQNSLNDNELVQQFINGDQESLEILICRHKSRVFSYILLIVKNQELAEDVFQETFIKVIRSLKRGKYIENGKKMKKVSKENEKFFLACKRAMTNCFQACKKYFAGNVQELTIR